jgi:Kef-type K+ transport system membrane component KefB
MSQTGLVLFMFLVGLELDPTMLRGRGKSSVMISHASIVVPFVLGVGLSLWLRPALDEPADALSFALFMGVAMSITAFPVLARILKDRNMTRTRIGQLSLGAAGVVDALAWILLALVVALASAGAGLQGFMHIAIGLVVLVAAVFLAVKPMLAWLLRVHAPDGVPSPMVLAALLIGMFVCAMLTEWLHLHAVFGAFLFGVALPRDDRLLHALTERIEPLSIVVLMPIFFALAGLGTSAGAFASSGLGMLALILLVASVGKIVGGAAGARICGYGWRESLATGSLMNSRGLMELIVIKVGLDAGLIGAELFTMLLAMALVTTAATGPLLSLIARTSPKPIDRPTSA